MNPACPSPKRGNTLMVVLLTTAITSVLVVSYMSTLQNSSIISNRSLNWNNALAVAEAGVEEASVALKAAANSGNLATNLTALNWTKVGNNLTRTRQLSNGYYGVLITSTNAAAAIGPANPPVIYSTGFVATAIRSGYINRLVKVRTKYTGSISFALLSRTTITMSGNPYIDSFDSSNTNYSNNGLYDFNRRRDQAIVGSASSQLGAVALSGNSEIFGTVITAPGGTAIVSANSSIGTLAFVMNSANGGKTQSGHFNDNIDANFTTNTIPFTSGNTLYATNISGTSYPYTANGANGANYYKSGNLTLSSSQTLLIQGKVTLYITGSLNVGGNAQIKIDPGSSLTLVVGGPSCIIGGNGVLNNSQSAANCTILGLPTCTTVTVSGNGAFIGTVNAPQATGTISGNGDFSGSFIANSIALTGNGGIHYDEALGKSSASGYAIYSWSEL